MIIDWTPVSLTVLLIANIRVSRTIRTLPAS
jgi:hypothetical protein